MKILFDFITVRVKTGAGEYHRRVFFELLKAIEYRPDIIIYALYDSSKGIAYEDLREDAISAKYNIEFIDCKDKLIDFIVYQYKIDKFFIACGHYLRDNEEISKLKCEVICVIHDLYGEENFNNKIYQYQDLINPNYSKQLKEISFKWRILTRLPIFNRIFPHDIFSYRYIRGEGNELYRDELKHIEPAIKLILNNQKTTLITVSEYSKSSIQYYFNIPRTRIKVLYSPERIKVEPNDVQNLELRKLVEEQKKYYIMMSANRSPKNPYKVINSFKRFSIEKSDAYLVTLSYPTKEFENHISLPFLNDSDLIALFKHCYALIFPSFFEGFGYPPLEAMHYGKPVLCTNTSSLPDIFEDAPIYFTPFYEASIYHALNKLSDDNYDEYCKKSSSQYHKIRHRQEIDLKKLIELLVRQ